MEPSSLGGGGGLFSGMGSAMLGLELPLHQHQTNSANPPNTHQLHHPQMVSYVQQHEPDHHHPQPQPSVKYSYPAKPKQQQSNLSDEDEPGFAADDSNGDAKKKISPWQRMKWTDMMVRLLITAVFYIGDEGGSEATDHTGKKKSVGLLQKKGKWKSVSRAMMEKGFYVSPQQCEDKFNDLNKRYKRVNDILGKGTACRVVENQSLLDSMELTPKMKEEVRKLLNSKHLFFREMCAYHNSCRHGAATSATHHSPDTAAEPSHVQQQQQPPQLAQQQQRCFHTTENHVTPSAANLVREEAEVSKSGDEEEEEEEDGDDSEEEEEDDEDQDIEGTSRGHEEEDETDERCSRKRPRKGGFSAATQQMQQLSTEVMGVLQDGGKSPWEKKQWMKSRLIHLEEQQVNYQSQAFDLEKQRLKWLKYRSKKERDMERSKLENEKRRLENERMLLLVKQKELDLLDLHYYQQQQQQQHSSNKRGDPSSITG